MNDMTFTVAVNFNSHVGLQAGTPDGLQFVAVQAADDVTATLVAAQMVACHGVMPTRTTVIGAIA